MAQKYILDDNFADSIPLQKIEVGEDHSYETLGKEVMKLPLGEVVEVKRGLKENESNYAAIEVNGKEYGVHSRYLLFSDENPEGVEDIFENTRERENHTWQGKLFATFAPYVVMASLFLAAILFMVIGLMSKVVRKISLVVVPVCMIVASVLEIWAYSVLGSDAFWWCSYENYGFWGSLLRAIPFVVFVAFQLYSIKGYERLLLDERSDVKLSIKPAAISLVICIPVTILAVVCMTLMGHEGVLRDVVSVAAFLLSFGIGVFISLRKNIKILGKFSGLLFTIFSMVYIVASVIAIIGLIIVALDLIFQILMIVAGILGVAFAAGTSGGSSGGGGNKEAWRNRIKENDDGTWSNGDICGTKYKTRSDAEFHANKNI
jgi:hypothetical protein